MEVSPGCCIRKGAADAVAHEEFKGGVQTGGLTRQKCCGSSHGCRCGGECTCAGGCACKKPLQAKL